MPRSLDHAVLAAHDLAAQKDLFECMGFQVGARNRHPWGTENHIIQFDGTFLELITTGANFIAPVDPDPHLFSFAVFVHNYLARREGFAMLALHTDNAQFDHDAFKYEGIGDFDPFHFERHGKLPDGSPIHVGFTLVFARSAELTDAGFFTCQQHMPENFWNAAYQKHPNGAAGLEGVILCAENPAKHAGFLANFTDQRDAVESGHIVSFQLAQNQRLDIMTREALTDLYGESSFSPDLPDGALAGVRIAVADLAAAGRVLKKAKVTYEARPDLLVVPPSAAFGVAIIFCEPSSGN